MNIRSEKLSAGIVILFLLWLLPAAALASDPPPNEGVDDGALERGPEPGSESLTVALGYLNARAEALGLEKDDLAEVFVTDSHTSAPRASGRGGITHVYLRQRLGGVEVANANASIHVRDGEVLYATNTFVRGLRSAVEVSFASLSAEQAVARAAESLGLEPEGPMSLVSHLGGASREALFHAPELSREEIRARQVYLALDSGTVRLAWHMGLYPSVGDSYWNLYVDAETGLILEREDLVAHDNYQVFAIPKENPDDGPRTVEMGPADPVASPFGWHDTNGVAGAEFTDTRGNNVFAQEDQDANNFGGFRPNGGPSLDFQFPLDLNLEPSGYQAASITNLFYWNNILHDIHHYYGFDEAAGNFQQINYTGATGGGDAVRADAQDGSGVGNANFLTLPDGIAPRMQMFIWGDHVVEVNAPAGIAGIYQAGGSSFGAPVNQTGLTDDVVLAVDGVGSPNDGCSALINPGQINGNIAILDRGTCAFTIKVKNAQNAGAVAAIVVNNVDDEVFDMGGSDPTINIPSVFMGLTDGTAIKNALPGVNLTIRVEGFAVPNRDSSFDNGIITHEYGHGISNRLTGGKSDTTCLNGNQSRGMGEGWSDFWALALTAKAGDKAADPRGIGTYVLFEPPTGNGIREFPYTTDMAVNPHTFADIASVSIPHGIGSVWAAMLWEVYWNMVQDRGFSTDFYAGTKGNNRALQLVMDGLKMQGCRPRFTDARDAILAADKAVYENANHCSIWQGFAKRGLGFSADAGPNHTSLVITEAFDVPSDCYCGAQASGTWKHPTLAAAGAAYGDLNDSGGTKVFGMRASVKQTTGTGGTIVGGLSDSTAPSPDFDIRGTWRFTNPANPGRFSADILDPVSGEVVGRMVGKFDVNLTGSAPGSFTATWELCR